MTWLLPSSELVLPPGALPAGELAVVLWASDSRGEAVAQGVFIADAIRGGEVSATPADGYGLHTLFTLTTPVSSWVGGERPLQFVWAVHVPGLHAS